MMRAKITLKKPRNNFFFFLLSLSDSNFLTGHDGVTSIYCVGFHNNMPSDITIPTEVTPLLAEEIGLHLGDGSMNIYRNKTRNKGFYQLRGHIVDDREHYRGRIRWLYKRLYGLDVGLRTMPSTGVFGFQVWSDQLVRFKHDVLGLPLGKKTWAEVPKEVMSDPELAVAFLRGLFDSDGGLYVENKRGKPYPKASIATISGKMMVQVSLLLHALDVDHAYFVERRTNINHCDYHIVRMNGYERVTCFFDLVRPRNPKHMRKYERIKNGPARI